MNARKLRNVFIACIAMFATTVQSQNFSYGVIVGADITNLELKGVPMLDADGGMYLPVLSYNINGFVSYKTSFFLGMSLEPGFARKAGIQLFDYMNSNYEPVSKQVYTTYNALQLPVLLDFYLNEKLSLSVGCELDYIISQKARILEEATTKHVFAGSVPLYASLGNGPTTLSDYIVPGNEFHFSYYSPLFNIQYKLNDRYALSLRTGFSLTELYNINWITEDKMHMGSSGIHSSFYQLALKIKI